MVCTNTSYRLSTYACLTQGKGQFLFKNSLIIAYKCMIKVLLNYSEIQKDPSVIDMEMTAKFRRAILSSNMYCYLIPMCNNKHSLLWVGL